MFCIRGKFYDWSTTYIIHKKRNIACALGMLLITMTMYLHVAQNMVRQYVRIKAYSFLLIALFLCILQGIEIKIADKWRITYGMILFLIAPGVAFYSMEYMNDNKISEMTFMNAALNYAIYLFVYLLLFIITNRLSASIIVGNVLFFVYIVINDFVYQYRGNPIRAYDILAMGTALSVAEGYEFKLNYRATLIMIYMFVVILFALKIRWHEKNYKKRFAITICLFLVGLTGCNSILTKEYIEKNNLVPDNWAVDKSAIKHGMIWDLVAGIPYLQVEKPEGYSINVAKEIEKQGAENVELYSEKNENSPDIIAIMNESFSDLSVLGELETSEECLGYFNSLYENVVRGNLYVPIRGGLTCNSEFEFMTGYSCAFLPSGSIAYQTVIKKGTYNLGKDLQNLGYNTTFMHPYYAKGWNRNGVYKNFEFDNAVFLEDMTYDENSDYIRGYVSDSANYRKIIEEYEKQKEQEESSFIFDVTMQNHGGYLWGMNEVEILNPVGNDSEAAEYLSLIKKSDEAFQELINYYSSVETPTIVLMFGDHQPTLTNFTDEVQADTNSDDIAGRMEEYCVPFVIWANYDIEEKTYDGVSVNFLQVLLKETAGQPLNTYQRYLKDLMAKYPVITNRGVRDSAGTWYRFEDAKEFEEIQNYSKVQYYKLIDTKINR